MLFWLLAARPKTLTAAWVPVVVGASLAYAVHGTIRIGLSALALLSAILIQIGTNLINDALDFKKGADTAERIGPLRVTQSGLIRARSVWWAGVFCFALAAAAAVPLVFAGGWPIVAIGLFSILAGYAYTGGPFPLAYSGLGDFFVLVFFGWIAVGGVYYLNTGLFDPNALLAGTQIGLLATVLIAINNFRDHHTDKKASKNTLPVRFGPRFARMEIAALGLAPFALGILWIRQGLGGAMILPLPTLPLAARLVNKVCVTPPSPAFNGFLAQAALLHLLFGTLLAAGLAIG